MNARLLAVWAVVVFAFVNARANVIVIKNGDVISGKILQTNTTGLLIECQYGTVTYPFSMIKRSQIEAIPANAHSPTGATNVLPTWGDVINKVAKCPWSHDLHQIAATVIDKGALRDVPYLSFHCGVDYEVNIYGDPDHPAGIEIGIYRSLLNDAAAKSNCVALIQSVLSRERDLLKLQEAMTKQGVVEDREMTYEITLPNQDDSYGGWWVSVYDRNALDRDRASNLELETIATHRAIVAAESRPVGSDVQTSATNTNYYGSSSLDDSGKVRGDRVYVNGYYRKNGTYVAPYTRSYLHHR